MGQLVPAYAEQLATFKQAIAWFRPKRPELFQRGHLPVFIHFSDEGEFYAVPSHSERGFKLGGPHFAREAIDPDEIARVPSARQLAALQGFVARFMPDANLPPSETRGCIYTKTPDEDFVIDTVPGLPQVLAVSACSGHGYKFAPVLGEIIADYVTKGAARFELGPFSFGRFGALRPPGLI